MATVQATLLANMLRFYVALEVVAEMRYGPPATEYELAWAWCLVRELLGPDVYPRQACTRTYEH